MDPPPPWLPERADKVTILRPVAAAVAVAAWLALPFTVAISIDLKGGALWLSLMLSGDATSGASNVRRTTGAGGEAEAAGGEGAGLWEEAAWPTIVRCNVMRTRAPPSLL